MNKTGKLLVGAAIGDITPQKSLFLYGYPHVERYSEGTHDPLYASAVVIENGINKIALCAMDLVCLPNDLIRDVRARVCRATGIVEKNIQLCVSHTHSGPKTTEYMSWSDDNMIPKVDREYMSFLIDSLAELIIAANNNLVPAEFAITTTDATGVGGNRRSDDGAYDPEVPILVFRKESDRQLLALVSTYCMHPTVLHEDSKFYSADFPGYTRQFLKEKLGEEMVYLYQTGPEGNQSPRRFVESNTFEEAERLGNMLGEKIVDAVKNIQEDKFTSSVSLSAGFSELSLPLKDILSLEEAEKRLKEIKAKFEQLKIDNAPIPEIRTAECTVFGAEADVELAKNKDSGKLQQRLDEILPIELNMFEINNNYFAYMPGELFVEYSLMLKDRSEAPMYSVCIAGELEGYVVTEEAMAEGGYESGIAIFSARAGTMIVEKLLRLQKEM